MELTISWCKRGVDVADVLSMLKFIQVDCKVTSSQSVWHGQTEHTATILFYNLSDEEVVRRVWPPLRGLLDLRCAHIRSPHYIGCIHDFVRPSSCPWADNAQALPPIRPTHLDTTFSRRCHLETTSAVAESSRRRAARSAALSWWSWLVKWCWPATPQQQQNRTSVPLRLPLVPEKEQQLQ